MRSDAPALRTWKTKQPPSEEIMLDLQEQTGLSRLTVLSCWQRGLSSAQAIRAFLTPSLHQLTPPERLKDMEKAATRLAEARNRKELVFIFADYDVDGTCGAALLTWFFRDLGVSFEVRQPDRFLEGYGLNVSAVEACHKQGGKLLMTVDCGITSFEAAKRAQELGIDLLILDHHQVHSTQGVPQAFAIVNPQQADCPSGLKQLCGCALAFYFALAVRAEGRRQGWFAHQPEPSLKPHLDLVVMATAADIVPLVGDNHILARFGFQVLRTSEKPGIRALLRATGLSAKGQFSPSYLGFVIGPRINAAGRLQSAQLAYMLLTTQDPEEASRLAQTLEDLNQQRMALQNTIWDEVRDRIQKGLAERQFQHGVVVADTHWHEGVLGIVASRITDFFHKPAIVLSMHPETGKAKGSARSFGGKDVLAALTLCQEHLLQFGGHRHAAGLALDQAKVLDFTQAFDTAMSQLPSAFSGETLWLEGDCSLEELTPLCLEELEALGPFGPGNPEPVFALAASVRSYQILKDRHLKLWLENASTQRPYEAIWFHVAESRDSLSFLKEKDSSVPSAHTWAVVPELNRFRDQKKPSLRIKDRQATSLILALTVFLGCSLPLFQKVSWATPSQKEIRLFMNEQRQEQASLLQNLKAEKKKWKELQKKAYREWEQEEKQQRRLFFQEHSLGSERRQYIQAFLQRRTEKRQALKNAEQVQERAVKAALDQLKNAQSLKYQRFLNSEKEATTLSN